MRYNITMDTKKSNILLIGMPGSGKSTIGRHLSEITGMPHIDGDELIERFEGLKLQQIIDSKGLDYFSVLEEKILTELDIENHIISPGGSAVYYPNAMQHLKEICTVVYLFTDMETLLSHIKNLDSRGIAFRPGQTFADIYSERCPLYEKYADLIVVAGHSNPLVLAKKIASRLGLSQAR